MHIRLAQDLAAESNAGELLGGEQFLFGERHLGWFSIDELDPASGATSLTPAGMQLVGTALLAEGGDKPFAGRDVELT